MLCLICFCDLFDKQIIELAACFQTKKYLLYTSETGHAVEFLTSLGHCCSYGFVWMACYENGRYTCYTYAVVFH